MVEKNLNVRPIADWLDAGAAPARQPAEVLLHLCHRLLALGISLHRVAVFVRTLHPNVAGRGFIWHAARDAVEVTVAPVGIQETEIYLKSPIRVVYTQQVEVRRRIGDPACPMDFPILDDMRAEGATDFLAVPVRFLNGEVHAASFVTAQPGGFTEADLDALRAIMPPFSRVAEIYALRRLAQNILEAYLGRQAGDKVLAGSIRRGDAEQIHAVIWFCDLRESTPLAESMSRAAFLGLLNEFFDCVLTPVLERGGEVLRFIGDAALAIFPVGDDPAEACRIAAEAARDAVSRMQALNAKRTTPLGFGIGLHLGDLTYGNIGTPTRIEFTVVGAAANEAARIEGLCKTLKVNVLVSERVARHLAVALRSLGRHVLRGVGEPVEVFTPTDP